MRESESERERGWERARERARARAKESERERERPVDGVVGGEDVVHDHEAHVTPVLWLRRQVPSFILVQT